MVIMVMVTWYVMVNLIQPISGSSSELCKRKKHHGKCNRDVSRCDGCLRCLRSVTAFTCIHWFTAFFWFCETKLWLQEYSLKYAFVMVGQTELKWQSAKKEASKANQKRVASRRTVTIAQQRHQTKRTKRIQTYQRAIALWFSLALWHDSPTTICKPSFQHQAYQAL